MSFCVLSCLRRNAGSVNHAPCTTMITDCIDFAGGEPGIHQNRPSIDRRCCQQNRYEHAAVFAYQHYAIAGANADIAQPNRGLCYRLSKLSMGPATVNFDQNPLVRTRRNRWVEQVADAV